MPRAGREIATSEKLEPRALSAVDSWQAKKSGEVECPDFILTLPMDTVFPTRPGSNATMPRAPRKWQIESRTILAAKLQPFRKTTSPWSMRTAKIFIEQRFPRLMGKFFMAVVALAALFCLTD